jgi:hypothetical protein
MPPDGPVDIPFEAFTALQELRAAIEPLVPQHLDFAIGIKQVDGEFGEDLALVVLIPDKLPFDLVPPEQLIPTEFAGFLTDVVQFRPVEIADTAPHDPLVGGCQISRPAFGTSVGLEVRVGTLGAIARNRSDGARLMLTAGHVLPDAGVEVHQPADLVIGHRVVGLSDRAASSSDWLDCAVAVIQDGQAASAVIADVGPVLGTSTVQLWQQVFKRGHRTGLTSGLVVAVVPDESLAIKGMIIDTFPFGGLFCWHGDSGSAIVNSSNEVVGLLFAMHDDQTDDSGTPVRSLGVASDINRVLDTLLVDLEVSP